MKKAIAARMTSYWRSVLICGGLGALALGCVVAQGVVITPWVLGGQGTMTRKSQGVAWTLDMTVASPGSLGGVGGVNSGDMFALASDTVYRYRYNGNPYPLGSNTGAVFANGPAMFSDIYANISRMITGPDNMVYITLTNHFQGVYRLDPLTGARQTVATMGSPGGLAFGPDANSDGNPDLYVGSGTSVKVWDTTTLTPATPITTLTTGAPSGIGSLGFIGNEMVVSAGRYLYVYSALDGSAIDLGYGPGVFSNYSFNWPGDMAIGYNGNLYVAETFGSVQMYTSSGGTGTAVGGSGSYYAMGFYNLPEPASLALLALGGLMLLRRRK